MYNNGSIVGGGLATGGGVLAATGLNLLWGVLAAFAFIAVGVALMRIIPKRNKGNEDE